MATMRMMKKMRIQTATEPALVVIHVVHQWMNLNLKRSIAVRAGDHPHPAVEDATLGVPLRS
jgi:hypothetical protein